MHNGVDCRRCGAEEETSANTVCRSEAPATLTHTHLDSFFLDPENVRHLNLGVIWNFIKGTDSHELDFSFGGTKGLKKSLRASRPKGLEPIHSFQKKQDKISTRK